MSTQTNREPSDAEKAILAWAEKHGVTVESEFVPWSRSRAKDDFEEYETRSGKKKRPRQSLQWRVTIKRNGREVLTTDYGAGIAHAPCYMWNPPKRHEDATAYEARLEAELEQGFVTQKRPSVFNSCDVSFKRVPDPAYAGTTEQQYRPKVRVPILPGVANVLSSLLLDASALDSGGFENWASELGYDSDSIKAKAIFDSCMDIALKMRGAFGDAGLEALREAAQDY